MNESDRDLDAEEIGRRGIAAALGALALTACSAPEEKGPLRAFAQGLTGLQTNTCDTIADLRTLSGTGSPPLVVVTVLGYWSDGDGGGGIFYYDSACSLPDDGGITILPNSLTGADGGPTGNGRWRRVLNPYLPLGQTGPGNAKAEPSANDAINVKWFGAKGDMTGDDSPAINAAIRAAGYPTSSQYDNTGTGWGQVVFIPKGSYKCQSSITVNRRVILRGAGGTLSSGATNLQFPAGVSGIVVTFPDPMNPSNGAGTASEIADLVVYGPGTGASAHGIVLNARAMVRNVGVYNFKGDGFHVEGYSGNTPPTNANGWTIINCTTIGNGNWGLYAHGTDANAGTCINLLAQTCGVGGVADFSALGCTFVSCTVENCGALNPSYANNNNGTCWSTFVGCYAEVDTGLAHIYTPGAVIGGLLADSVGTPGSTYNALTLSANGSRWLFSTDTPALGTGYLRSFLGRSDGRSLLQFSATAPENGAVSGFIWSNTRASELPNGWYAWCSNTDQPYAFAVSGASAQMRSATLGNSYLWITNDLFFGSPLDATQAVVRWKSGGGIPSSGTWAQGDRVWNGNTAAGAATEWVCVAGGTPGTWRVAGTLAATAAPASGTWSQGDVVFNSGAVNTGDNAGWICVVGGTPGTWKKFGALMA